MEIVKALNKLANKTSVLFAHVFSGEDLAS